MYFNLWGITFCADGITFCGSLLDDHIITFWVKWYYILSQQCITFCAGRYYILRQVLHFAPMVLHFAEGITFCAVITFCGSTGLNLIITGLPCTWNVFNWSNVYIDIKEIFYYITSIMIFRIRYHVVIYWWIDNFVWCARNSLNFLQSK